MTIVPGYGPQPARILVISKMPAYHEVKHGRPLAGPTGDVDRRLCEHYGLDPDSRRLENVVGERGSGKDPTPELVERWTPITEAVIRQTEPQVIWALGQMATRWFLGDKATMAMCHGVPHVGGCFDESIAHRANGAIVVPIYLPTNVLTDKTKDKTLTTAVRWDYKQACGSVELSKAWGQSTAWMEAVPHDEWAGREAYVDVGGAELAERIQETHPTMIGLDTEGDSRDVRVSKPWSVQISMAPGSGMSLRVERGDFGAGIRALQDSVNNGCAVAVHNYCYDGPMCQKMGLDLSRAEIVDTMYSAYLTRIEPQRLKPLAWRHCGMVMDEYEAVVGDAALSKQAAYLMKVLLWKGCPDPPLIYETKNNGTAKVTKPKNVRKLVGAIFSDYGADKTTKTDGPVDLYKRWHRIDPRVRKVVEERFGEMPVGTLADVDLVKATKYGCRDSDAALRLALKGIHA